MLLTFKIKNGKTLQFESSDSIHKSFNYPTEYGSTDYYDISFFLTTHLDIIMTAGRILNNNNNLIDSSGTYEVPFVLVINSQLLTHINTTNVLGIKFRADAKGFIKNLMMLLDKKLETHFMIKPFLTEYTKNISDTQDLIEMLSKMKNSEIVQEQILNAKNYIDQLRTISTNNRND